MSISSTLAHLPGDLAVHLDHETELDGSTCSASGSSQLRNSARLNGECGATGTTSSPCVRGETIGPPAAKAYAVEPVGVEITTASAAYRTNGLPSTRIPTAAPPWPGTRTSAMSLNASFLRPRKQASTAVRPSTL